ncbi:MAG: Ger(x)C family spore germination protein [Clostridia bacterium]|nr:Ger(x)C family spore germination protein [Clostridia bacterium]
MKAKHWTALAIIIMTLITLGGNWNRKEPKDLAIGTAFLYDKNDEGLYEITVEFLDLPQSGGQNPSGGGGQPGLIKTFSGLTVGETIRDISVTVEKTLYGSQNRVRFISEKYAMEDGIENVTDFFLRDHIADERPYLVVVKNQDPKKIFEASRGMCERLGDYVFEIASSRQTKKTSTYFVETLTFVRDYYEEGKQPVITVIEAVPDDAAIKQPGEQNEPAKDKLIFEGLGVMKDDKLVGYLDKTETRTYLMIADTIKTATVSVPIDENYIAAKVLKISPDIKTSMKDGKVKIQIDYNMKLMLKENHTDFDITDPESVERAEQAVNSFFEDETKRSIARVQQEYKSDIFGFGRYFHKQNSSLWKEIKSQWDDVYFPNAEIVVTMESDIAYEGEIRERFGEIVKNG